MNKLEQSGDISVDGSPCVLLDELLSECSSPEDILGKNGLLKQLQTESGTVEIEVPRDRDSSFEPQLVAKRQRRVSGLDDKIIALYARGLSTRDIQGDRFLCQHLHRL